MPNPYEIHRIWHKRPDEDTEPCVQRLFIGPYQETGMGSQDLASAGFCVGKFWAYSS